jgi:hypothetical protein
MILHYDSGPLLVSLRYAYRNQISSPRAFDRTCRNAGAASNIALYAHRRSKNVSNLQDVPVSEADTPTVKSGGHCPEARSGHSLPVAARFDPLVVAHGDGARKYAARSVAAR